ncbi:DUF2510 domain-containing protein [Mycobacterium sp. 1274761.0]|uniref:DUF2510 domain-containing protein n=1 Tax=Mycobacterium sp. 1274761.0 TaxID=1834077 RepID=UPI00082B2BF3|nr:DUF2510 domain-containing protein [Mycobacterium sp. 1274761.0]
MGSLGNFAGTINSLIWLLIVIVVIAVIVWAVRMAFAPRGGREYRERTVVQQPAPSQPPPSGSLAPGWYPDQNDHRKMRYFDGRVWTSETRGA